METVLLQVTCTLCSHCVRGLSLWRRLCMVICSSVSLTVADHREGRGKLGGAERVCDWNRWVEKTLVLISPINLLNKYSSWAWRSLVGPLQLCWDSSTVQAGGADRLGAKSSSRSESSHVSHWELTFHPLLSAAPLDDDYLDRAPASLCLSSSLSSALRQTSRRGASTPVYEKWPEFSVAVLNAQFLHMMYVLHGKKNKKRGLCIMCSFQ